MKPAFIIYIFFTAQTWFERSSMLQYGGYHEEHYQGVSFFLSDARLVAAFCHRDLYKVSHSTKQAKHQPPQHISINNKKRLRLYSISAQIIFYIFSFLQNWVDSLFLLVGFFGLLSWLGLSQFLELLLAFQASLISKTQMKIRKYYFVFLSSIKCEPRLAFRWKYMSGIIILWLSFASCMCVIFIIIIFWCLDKQATAWALTVFSWFIHLLCF